MKFFRLNKIYIKNMAVYNSACDINTYKIMEEKKILLLT